MNVFVYVCLSSRDHIFRTTDPIFTKYFMHVTYGGGSVLWWRNDMQPWAWRVGIPVAGSERLGLTSCSQGLLGHSGRVEYL